MKRPEPPGPALRLRAHRPDVLLLLLLCLLADPASASSPYDFSPLHPALEPWRWRSFPELSDVQSMAEDAERRLWFGTPDGILTYDGVRFTNFGVPDSLVGNDVRALCFSDDGKMYAATDYGVGFFAGTEWTTVFAVEGVPRWPRTRLRKGPDGTIWATTVFGGLRLGARGLSLYTTPSIAAQARGLLPAGLKVVLMPEGLAEPEIWLHDVYPARDGDLWFGASTGVVFRLSPDDGGLWSRFDSDTPGFDSGKLPTLAQSSDGTVWAVSRDQRVGILAFDGEAWTAVPYGEGARRYMASLCETPDGALWIGGHTNLITIQNGALEIFDQPTIPIPQNILSDLFVASDGALWVIGQADVVLRFDYASARWASFPGLQYQCRDVEGALWFLADSLVVRGVGDHWTQYTRADGLMQVPGGLFCSRSTGVWAVGRQDSVAATSRFVDGAWVLDEHPYLSWDANNQSGFEATDGSFWVAGEADHVKAKGQKGGVIRFDPAGGWSHYFPPHNPRNPDPVIPPEAYAIGQTIDGELWFGGNRLRRFDGHAWYNVNDHRALKTWVHSILGTPEGDLWVGTRSFGVLHRTGEAWEQYSVQEGLPSRRIVSMTQTSDDVVWATTNRGIARFDGRTWTPLKQTFPKGWDDQDVWVKAGGEREVWVSFGSMSLRYRMDDVPPDTEISQFQAEVAQPGYTTLTWYGTDPWEDTPRGELQYAWRLDGGAWSDFSDQRSHLFSELSSGEHLFEVVARDGDFNRDLTPATVAFAVIPPIWQQPWFVGLVGFMMIVIGVQTNRVIRRDRRLQKSNVELSESRDAAEAANRAKSTFLANMSHEIRTPLNAILGYAQILESDANLTDRQQQAVRTIGTSGDHLLSLVNDVLDLSKIEAGREVLQETDFDLGNLLQGLSAMFRFRAEEKGLTWCQEFPQETLRVFGDQNKLRQVLINLLGNAVKFCDTGTVQLVVKCSDDAILFDVVDSGQGIPDSELESIFDPFQQEEAGVAKGGTGLGLAIARRHVEMMGGRLEVESTRGVETRFFFALRLPRIRNERAFPESADDIWSRVSHLDVGQSVDAVVVDDVAENRNLLAEILKRVGVSVRLAASGAVALDMVRETLPDIVFMDVVMPGMSGRETHAHMLREHGVSCPRVVAVSASVLEHERESILEDGFLDLISKPVRLGTVYACLAEQLNVKFRYEEAQHALEKGPDDTSPIVGPGALIDAIKAAARSHNLTKLREHINALSVLGEGERELAAQLSARTRQYDLKAIVDRLSEIDHE